MITLPKAKAIIESYRRFKISSSNNLKSMKVTSQQKWCPLLTSFVKINVDVVTNAENYVAGLGVMVRDCEGKFVVAAMKKGQFFEDVCKLKQILLYKEFKLQSKLVHHQ